MKRISTFFISLLMVFSLCVPCIAADGERFLQEVKTGANTITVYTDTIQDASDYSVTLGGEELPLDISTVETSGEPITYFCLVDVSGTMSGTPMNMVKETLKGIANHMRSGIGSQKNQNDRMIISTFDNKVTVGDNLKKGKKLTEAIDNLSISNGDTNLYSSIIESINIMTKSEKYHTKKCLIIFSDGVDCQDNGSTDTEVLQAIKQADFPIYTFATMTDNSQLEGGKILGSFGRASAGGKHFTTAVGEGGDKGIRTDISCTDISDEIYADMSGGSVITLDITGYALNNNQGEIPLKVTVTSGNSTLASETTISAQDLAASKATAEPTQKPTSEPTEEPTSEPITVATAETTEESEDTDDGLTTIEIVAIAAGALLVIAILVLLIVRHKNKKKEPAIIEDIIESEIPEQPQNDESKIDQPVILDVERPMPPLNVSGKTDVIVKIPVYMLEIPYGRNPVSFELPANGNKLTLGRSSRANVILSKNDSQLSGTHFSLSCINGNYYIIDENSTNGTLLNGVNIKGRGWTPVSSGDKVRAGEMEYRIMFGEDALQR